jgi:hypothetical protein
MWFVFDAILAGFNTVAATSPDNPIAPWNAGLAVVCGLVAIYQAIQVAKR